MSDIPVIDLIDFEGAGLVVLAKTGFAYSNQAGGTCCAHPMAEGVFVPLPDVAVIFGEMEDVIRNVYGRITDADGWAHSEDVATVAGMLKTACSYLELDTDYDGPWGEAWIPVRIVAPIDHDMEWLVGKRAILTYKNSD